ncbi:protein DD3-3-like [Montipora foliosa]|uniref:protein DD3-3-like n=1 Tax=Montipora foliosa TaxID=591990 RepID=UPI0035F154D9
MAIIVWGWLAISFIVPCLSDVYLHVPHGSNNRLNGNLENVKQANRLFDSQNNGKAGYNVGDGLDSIAGVGNIPETRQLPMEFYMSGIDPEVKTELDIMWTNQHGTGPETDDKVETQIILQYMCQPFPEGRATVSVYSEFDWHTFRNGQYLTPQAFSETSSEDSFIKQDRGLHEPLNYYRSMYRRERNKGLCTPDQTNARKKLAGDKAIYTRQNPGGARNGLEVPEERDYYPYWGPSPWKDIAILVSDKKTKKLMKDYVNSPHYGEKYLCIMPNKLAGNKDCPKKLGNQLAEKCVALYINKTECTEKGGKWTKFVTNYIERTAGVLSTCHGQGNMKLKYGKPYQPHKVSQGAEELDQYLLLQEPPEVHFAPSTVVNHNGMNMEGKFSSFKWKVPAFPSNVTQRCVLRIRYNITTDDFPREFTAKDNDKVKNDPKTKAVDGNTDLQLALDTTQLGRTFQDRSHVFVIKSRHHLKKEFQHLDIKYIIGMGKRGNIVQAYPAMEYRFFPEEVTVTTNTIICFAWSGSNNNPANNAGEGKAQTDRTNICWIKEGCSSLKPATCQKIPLEVIDQSTRFDEDSLNLYLNKGCYQGPRLQAQLDNAPASCNPPCFRITKPGEYCYMGTRNNNFSNRRHVGKITVTAETSAAPSAKRHFHSGFKFN